jgi:hypothetical protein
MINTNCEKCIFSKQDDKECLFDIPEIIKPYKNIEKRNKHNVIENYKCRYTLSDEIYQELLSEGRNSQEIIKFIIDTLKIRYYLVIDLDPDLSAVSELCAMIDKLDIQPQFISFINKNLDLGNLMSEIIQSKLKSPAKWKLHNFLSDLDLQQCMTICMDTNFNKTKSQIFLVYDHKKNRDKNILNKRINFLHMQLIVYQTHCQAIVENLEVLDGLAMSFGAYKLLINSSDPNILLAINKENTSQNSFKYINYEYDTN